MAPGHCREPRRFKNACCGCKNLHFCGTALLLLLEKTMQKPPCNAKSIAIAKKYVLSLGLVRQWHGSRKDQATGSALQIKGWMALHIGIVRPATPFWNNPIDILGWVFNVTSFAVQAVLGIDLQTRLTTLTVGQNFIDPSRAITLLGCVIHCQVNT